MKLHRILLVVLGFALNAFALANSGSSNESRLEVLLDVSTKPVDIHKIDSPYKYRMVISLTVRGQGADAYIGKPVRDLWSVVVLPESRDGEAPADKVQWNWLVKDQPSIIGPNVEGSMPAMAEWYATSGTKSQTYAVTATFIPTGETKVEKLTLPPTMTADILFTGKLFGYYRAPDTQGGENSEEGCERDIPIKDASRDAQIFFSKFSYDPSARQVRVGMGDNFAPNYYSRAFSPVPTDPLSSRRKGDPKPAGKDMYYWDTEPGADPKTRSWKSNPRALSNEKDIREGHGTIPTDNVACFLYYAHYHAIVPSKHDFYYGPERLRELARFLATLPSKDSREPVQMLAANMMIKTTWAKDHEPVADSAKHQLPFVTDYRQIAKKTLPEKDSEKDPLVCRPEKCSFEVTNIKDSGFAFPWMQYVRIDVKGLPNLPVSPTPPAPSDESNKKSPKFNEQTAPHVVLCKALTPSKQPAGAGGMDPGDPDSFMLSGKSCNQEQELRLDPTRSQKDGALQLVYDLPRNTLLPGHNYAVCIRDAEFAKATGVRELRPYCVRFSVHTPFFQYPDWPQTSFGVQKNPALWVVRNDSDQDRKDGVLPVVIFGIVDQQLLEHIGADNYSWQTTEVEKDGSDHWKKDYNTQVAIVDPVETLTHLQDYFEKEYNDSHKRPFEGTRVLLAQMPPGQAKQLAERLKPPLRFDVIISAADDALATPNQVLNVQPETEKDLPVNGATATRINFIAVPPSGAMPGESGGYQRRWLQARRLEVKTDGKTFANYTLSGVPIKTYEQPTRDLDAKAGLFWKLIRDTLCLKNKKTCEGAVDLSSKDALMDTENRKVLIQQLALWAIREKFDADIALLQVRDFYAPGVDDYLVEHAKDLAQVDKKLDLQEILDRVLWKGDFISTQSVTGTVLKSILKKSDQFAQAEKNAQFAESESGRPLVQLGLRPDPNKSGDFLINDKPLDPNALYTVATSDYIALGDTGYSDLATPPVGDPERPAMPKGRIFRISGITCDVVVLTQPNSSPFSKKCDTKIKAEEFFDRAAERKPDDPRTGNTNFRKFYTWTFLRRPLGQHPRETRPLTLGEAIAQATQKRLESQSNWNWSLDKLSVGFSALSHTDNEQALSQQFGGVLNSQANAKRSHAFDWDANSKFTFYHPITDWFASETLQYSSNFTAQASGPRSETQSRNLLAFDGGTYFHLYPWSGKKLPQLSLVLSGHFETQVASPFATVSVGAGSPPLLFDQGRTMLLLGRPGIRWENRKSYIEAGLEGGQTLNAIRQFNVLVAPGGPSVACRLEASSTLTSCISAFNSANPSTPVTASSTVNVLRSAQDRYGAYLNMGVTVPINDTISYNFTDSSDYFFLSHGDNSADTRFRHQLVHTLKFMVFPNLSFEPTYTLFFYENKLDYNFLFQQQYAVKINYSFNFSSPHEAKRQFKYKKPTGQ